VGTNENNDAEGIAVPTISPVCPLVLVEAPLSMDLRDADYDSTGRRVAAVKGNAFSRVAKMITHHRHFARRTTAGM
jgi:hypothetical protein